MNAESTSARAWAIHRCITDGKAKTQARLSLGRILDDLARAQAALAEIEAKPYRAEEVTARYRRETT